MRHRLIFLIVVMSAATACASNHSATQHSIGSQLLGKTRADIIACAGQPVKQVSHSEGLILRYYKEASLLEESHPTSKSSHSRTHEGCWTSLLIEEERVTGVQFRSVPDLEDSLHVECQRQFQSCLH
jgi:hypothetical protein